MVKKKASQNRRKPSPLSSPSPMESDKYPAPKSSILNKTSVRVRSKSSSTKKATAAQFDSLPPKATLYERTANLNISSVSDLRNLASSRLNDLKRNLIDRSHLEIVKDLEASLSRLHKCVKIQTQASQQLMEEEEKEYTKMSKRISESQEATKASYAEFIADAQATTFRLLKTSIPEFSKSFEKAVDALHSCYRVRSG